MHRTRSKIDNCTVVIDSGASAPAEVMIVERKGWGHPDTLADHLAERLSGIYSRYCVEHFGAVLHHNFDKLALLGGACEVSYGAGRMLAPVRVLVNGRAARHCAGTAIPVDELATETVRGFFAERLPELAGHLSIELNITSNPSPGAVLVGDDAPDRAVWFAPRSLDDLRERQVRLSNDTSLGTGWAPENRFETFARDLVDHFAAPGDFAREHLWCGSDVKMMGYATADEVDVVLCVPQKSGHVASRDEYLANRARVLAECTRFAVDRLGD
ncbi:MAG: methionine adenosyltransferase, partial [Nocardioides sp.]